MLFYAVAFRILHLHLHYTKEPSTKHTIALTRRVARGYRQTIHDNCTWKSLIVKWKRGSAEPYLVPSAARSTPWTCWPAYLPRRSCRLQLPKSGFCFEQCPRTRPGRDAPVVQEISGEDINWLSIP